MKRLAVSIVTRHPDPKAFRKCLASLREQRLDGWEVEIHVLDNSCSAETVHRAREILDAELSADTRIAGINVHAAKENLGFGRGQNANYEAIDAPLVLTLNQDIELEPGALDGMLAFVERDDARAAAWEFRQIPYEHPKDYDPVTLSTPWVSGAATLFLRAAVKEVGGFDAKIFMYGEDVDLSWRLRAKGWLLRYVPRFACVHRTYDFPAQIKPLQVTAGTLSNLCLRARFGRSLTVLRGIALLLGEALAPQSFPGRRAALARNLVRFLVLYTYFRRTRVRPNEHFSPFFSGWNYELRRDGAFFEFPSRRQWPGANPPKVSILIRTVGRHSWLRHALATVAHQTYPNVEAVVIEDGPATSQEVVSAFADRLPIVYHATGERTGRSRAGNAALAAASGEWLGFLDDDDLLFADHVEVLLYSALKAGVKGVYAIGWETVTRTIDTDNAIYEEVMHNTRYAQPFDRIMLWHHNYLPIQAVLFHRSLYERHGGFEEDMDFLEDWNLWTRYTLNDDFLFVEKTTSKYRVPAESFASADRQRLLDEAYADARERQKSMRFESNPRDLYHMISRHVQSNSLVHIAKPDVVRWFLRVPGLAWIARHRQLIRRILGRFRRR